jgi:hypothetical protein
MKLWTSDDPQLELGVAGWYIERLSNSTVPPGTPPMEAGGGGG